MGNKHGTSLPTHILHVKTGDKKGAGTDANVAVVLHDDQGKKSAPMTLDRPLRDSLERGSMDAHPVSDTSGLGKIRKMEITMDAFGLAPDWFVESVHIEHQQDKSIRVFPIHRWIRPKRHYVFDHLDCKLPQDDEQKEQRKSELEERRKLYEFAPKAPGLPVQVNQLPADEAMSDAYKWDIESRKKTLSRQAGLTGLMTLSGEWDSFDDIYALYSDTIGKPSEQILHWRDDEWFGAQRLAGVNTILIALCSSIPEKFGVTAEMVEPFLEGLTLKQALDAKRLFIIDLKILEGIRHNPETEIGAPLVLFFQKGNQRLVPVAIQLQQDKGPNNPVFLPSDHPMTWLYAKMYYNNADATFHQVVTHLGFTHLLIEGVALATHRNLSPSHPIFRLLAPHFLYLIAINDLAVSSLVSENGWVDKTMSSGRLGMFDVVAKAIVDWRLDIDGTLPKHLEARGLLDENVLPNFYYREDALPLYWIIKKYVSQIINHFYDSPEKMVEDYELNSWRQELELEREKGGIGIKGIPGSGTFSSNEELIVTCTSAVFLASVGHAAANFPQYAEYAFPPNYPPFIKGQVPTNKNPLSEEDILQSLSSKRQTLDVMVVTKILSEKGTNSLGDFEVQYLYDPVSVKAADTIGKNWLS
ncbi:allene oxide synthase-lipoxygenase protein-like [Lingula anatina]|uniref:Allene oxide synthase-lipoxygenase protein-like n=1 Tax=Lingula anatina TaxID=7574 RepID=A0A2R2MJZ4_LINAN|nr:allene oxide synthase-lipoxygenase protein-like [Lingula anatina]|eukprot:XP_023930539.1 allene oxide synthase-lipoxygenase protein-like [Lingula anatina]